jgi:ApaG protein
VKRDSLYEATTKGIRIRVQPEYNEDQSAPDESYYFWTYTIEISNQGKETVQLKSRVWKITNAFGRTEEVRGPGVVGQTPTIAPGSYQMTGESGKMFDVTVPAFSLDSPFAVRSMN